VLAALDLSRFEPVLIGIDKAGRWLIQDAQRLLRDAGIPVADFRTVRRERFDADPQRVAEEVLALGLPLFTKPANAGSSVGIRKVSDAAQLEDALRYAFQFDSKVLAEAAISGREIELAVLGGSPATVSVAGEVIVEHADGFYSYDAKYLDEHGARLELPAQITADDLARAQTVALRSFGVLECEGMARVDLFLKPDGSLLVNEINTIPGFTAISMYPKLWALSGVAPTELVSRLIDLALERGRRRAPIGTAYGSADRTTRAAAVGDEILDILVCNALRCHALRLGDDHGRSGGTDESHARAAARPRAARVAPGGTRCALQARPATRLETSCQSGSNARDRGAQVD